MAKGNIVRWITIKGRRIPIYEDGSMGGFMEGKQHQEKSEGRKTYRVYYEDGNQKLLEADSKEELDAYLKEHEKETGKVSRAETADEYDAYDREHKEGKYKNDFQNKADEYREKFLTKRSDEEIEDIKKNLDKSTAIVGTTEDDHVAYKAIEDEQKRRYSDEHRSKTGPLHSMTDDQVMEAALQGDRNAVDEMSKRGLSTTKDLQEYKNRQKGSKLLEDHPDIQKIAEDHVKKIWNGGAANRELYDAADKWAEEHNFDKTKAKDAAFAAMNKKQMAEIAKREKAKGFSAEAAAKDINAISMNHNNRGGDTENDWKKVRDTLEAAPAGTVMIQTGDRGAKYQFTKGEDGQWHGSWDSDSKTLSMGWVGQGHRPEVEFTTPDKALSKEQIKDTQTAAVNGKLNQQLGLDKNGYKIGNRSTPKVDVPEKSIKIGDKQVGVSKDPHAAEKIASAKKMVSNSESNLAGLRDQLKKHPNDEHTAEIKAAIKRAEGRVKDSKNTLAEREGKSINVGGKKVGVNKGKTSSIRDIVGSNGEYQIGKAYTKSNMMDIAEAAGIPRSKTSKMTVAELRKMMLAMWRKG